MANLSSICLGSAQFGLDYGITNLQGKPSNNEIKEIINFANSSGIEYIDTAKGYGSSEKIIGKFTENLENIKIITKFPKQEQSNWSKKTIEKWEDLLYSSLKDLRRKSIEGYLIHSIEDIKNPRFDMLLNWLIQKKEQGLIKKIGLSIYEAADLINIPLDYIDIVQLPLSIFDQRLLLDGTIDNLIKKNIFIHIRSLFLQGVLLNKTIKTKNFSKDFLLHHRYFHEEITKNKTTPLNEVFKFAKNLNGIECFIIGVNSLEEIKEIASLWNNIDYKNNIKGNFSWYRNNDLDPRNWNKN